MYFLMHKKNLQGRNDNWSYVFPFIKGIQGDIFKQNDFVYSNAKVY